ncbi:manganese-dependent peroxidase [Mycena pura]|uniref:Peroxidase n=1 Tax=Mycena pura TaxID=153505 RepID=A0AAD6VSS3_9AGAR|nr:manganese-dependent peroxidase [Mycena pura]
MTFKAFSSIILIAIAAARVASASLTKRVLCPSGHLTANAACCILFPISDDIQANLFDGGQCVEEVHESLRLTFHDANGFSPTFDETQVFHADDGIADILGAQEPFFLKFDDKLSAGDSIQFAGAIGLSNCPGAPGLEFLLGRPTGRASAASPRGLIPEPQDNITTILQQFAEVGFTPAEAIALIASHTIAAPHNVNESPAVRTPFDSTPGIFDTQIFIEMQSRGTLFPGATGNLLGESRLQTEFRAAMSKMATIGHNRAAMVDCSDVIPVPKPVTMDDIEQACATSAFPVLTADLGPATSALPV